MKLATSFVGSQKLGSEVISFISEIHNRILNAYKTISRQFTLSLALKLVLVTMPMASLPADATRFASTAESVDLTLAKNAHVFSAPIQIEFKPGDSNATISARESAKKRAAVTVESVQSVVASKPTINELRALYQEAGARFSVPWQVLEAIHQKETGKSGNTAKRSYAGATGPMQFMPGTWRAYVVDAGDGGNITSVRDSVFTAARYIRTNMDSHGGSLDAAILRYNRSIAYLKSVKTMANELGANI